MVRKTTNLEGGMTVDELLGQLDHVKKSRRGWRSYCPAHESDSRSLSIAEGDNGAVLLKCFVGCTPDKITAALGLTVADLFPGERDPYPNHYTPKTTEERLAAENRKLRSRILSLELRHRRAIHVIAHASNVLALCLDQDSAVILDRIWNVACADLEREASEAADAYGLAEAEA